MNKPKHTLKSIILAVFIAVMLVNTTYSAGTAHAAATSSSNQGEVSTSSIIHFYSLFAQHQEKIQTASGYTYVVYNTGTTQNYVAPAYWVIAKSTDMKNWQTVATSPYQHSFQPPSLLKVDETHLGLLYTGTNETTLYYQQFTIATDGSIKADYSGYGQTAATGAVAYPGATVDPISKTVFGMYYNGLTAYLVRRVNGTWESPRAIANRGLVNGEYRKIFYPEFSWSNGVMHLGYVHGIEGGSTGNYKAIYYMKSSDLGLTWQNAAGTSIVVPFTVGSENATLISEDTTSPNQFLDSIVADKNNSVHLVYRDLNNTNYYKRIDGVSHAITKTTLFPLGFDRVVVDNTTSTPTIYYVDITSTGAHSLHYKVSIDGGINWSNPTDMVLGTTTVSNGTTYTDELYAPNFQRYTTDGTLKGAYMLRDRLIDGTNGYDCIAPKYCRVESIGISVTSPTTSPTPSPTPTHIPTNSPTPLPPTSTPTRAPTATSTPTPTPATITYNIQVKCSNKSGQSCTTPFTVQLPTGVSAQVQYLVPSGHCSPLKVSFYTDKTALYSSPTLGWYGAPYPYSTYPLQTAIVTVPAFGSGTHTLNVYAQGVPGGCNTGTLSAWGGQLKVTYVKSAAGVSYGSSSLW